MGKSRKKEEEIGRVNLSRQKLFVQSLELSLINPIAAVQMKAASTKASSRKVKPGTNSGVCCLLGLKDTQIMTVLPVHGAAATNTLTREFYSPLVDTAHVKHVQVAQCNIWS